MNHTQHSIIGGSIILALLLTMGGYIATNVPLRADVTSTPPPVVQINNGTFDSSDGWNASQGSTRFLKDDRGTYAAFSRGTVINGTGTLAQDFPGFGLTTPYSIRGKVRVGPSLPETNYIADPSFEAGSTPSTSWVACDPKGKSPSSQTKNTGTWSLLSSCIEQTITLPKIKNDEMFQLTFFGLNTDTSTTTNEIQLRSELIQNGTPTLLRTAEKFTIAKNNQWEKFTSLPYTFTAQSTPIIKLTLTGTSPLLFDDISFKLSKAPTEDLLVALWDVGNFPPRLVEQKTISSSTLISGLYDWTEDQYFFPKITLPSPTSRLQLKFETLSEYNAFYLDDIAIHTPLISEKNTSLLFNSRLADDLPLAAGAFGDSQMLNNIPNGWKTEPSNSFTYNLDNTNGTFLKNTGTSGGYFNGATIEQYLNIPTTKGSTYIAEAIVTTGPGTPIEVGLWLRHNPGSILLEEQSTRKTLQPNTTYRIRTGPMEINKKDSTTIFDATKEMKEQLLGVAFALQTPNSSLQLHGLFLYSCALEKEDPSCKQGASTPPQINTNSTTTTNGNTNMTLNANTVISTNTNTSSTTNGNSNVITPTQNTNSTTSITTEFSPSSFPTAQSTQGDISTIIKESDTSTTHSSGTTQTCPPLCPADSRSFYDIPTDHFAANAVRYLTSREIMEGATDGSFHPEQLVNRAEFSKIAVRAFLLSQSSRKPDTFSDLSAEDWYAPYALIMNSLGIMQGYGEEKAFRGEKTINRAEAAKILSLSSKLTDAQVQENFLTWRAQHPDYSYVFFKDVPVTAWYAPYVYHMTLNGYITGREEKTGKVFAPNAQINRAEAAVIFARMIFAQQIKYPVQQEKSTGLVRILFSK